MKTKNLILYASLLIMILGGAYACDDNDGYSLGDFRLSIATVIPEGDDAMTYSLLLDNGQKLWPAASAIAYKPTEDQRVFVNYTLLSDKQDGYDHYVKVNDIWNILTKPVIELTEEIADSIGHDPVQINELWIGNNFLNVDFSFNYGGEKPHAINLVQNKMEGEESTDDVLELEFRHNAFGSTSNSLANGLASFDLKPFRDEEKDSIFIRIKVKDWEGSEEFDITYKYDNLQNIQARRSAPIVTSKGYK